MSKTYKATGINLKSAPMGESDRLLTILTPEYGLIRAIAPGARKHQSSLRGRSGLFVVNQLLIVEGRSLDKIIQAETLDSYTGLSQDLRKLTASQYLAELVLCQAMTEQPQEALFEALRSHLSQIEHHSPAITLACLNQATFHLLTLAGLTPRLDSCCLTQEVLVPDFDNPDWRVGFNPKAGGTVKLSEKDREILKKASHSRLGSIREESQSPNLPPAYRLAEQPSDRRLSYRSPQRGDVPLVLTALELSLMRQLMNPDLIQPDGTFSFRTGGSLSSPLTEEIWLAVERVLRKYVQYHFERPIRSATLIDSCFTPTPLLSSLES